MTVYLVIFHLFFSPVNVECIFKCAFYRWLGRRREDIFTAHERKPRLEKSATSPVSWSQCYRRSRFLAQNVTVYVQSPRRDRENSNRITKPRVADNSRALSRTTTRHLTTILIVAYVASLWLNNKMKDVYHNNSFRLSISSCECSTVSEKIRFRMSLESARPSISVNATRFLAVTMIRNNFIWIISQQTMENGWI